MTKAQELAALLEDETIEGAARFNTGREAAALIREQEERIEGLEWDRKRLIYISSTWSEGVGELQADNEALKELTESQTKALAVSQADWLDVRDDNEALRKVLEAAKEMKENFRLGIRTNWQPLAKAITDYEKGRKE